METFSAYHYKILLSSSFVVDGQTVLCKGVRTVVHLHSPVQTFSKKDIRDETDTPPNKIVRICYWLRSTYYISEREYGQLLFKCNDFQASEKRRWSTFLYTEYMDPDDIEELLFTVWILAESFQLKICPIQVRIRVQNSFSFSLCA